jgi:NAD(P)-dependent dehydrogenase (short-subunit alcohol dehydrogenase family)
MNASDGMDLSVLSGGVAVLTGSGSGLGYALACKVASLGMHVVISDIRATVGRDAATQLKNRFPAVQCVSCPCDVTSMSDMEALLAFTQSTFPNKHIQFVCTIIIVLHAHHTHT